MEMHRRTPVGRTLALLVPVAVPLLGFALLSSSGARWHHLPLHAAIEVAGAVIAFLLVAVLARRPADDDAASSWLLVSVLATAVFDLVHALAGDGPGFFWTRAAGCTIGGMLGAAVWLPRLRARRRTLFVAIGTVAAAIAVAIGVAGDRLPEAYTGATPSWGRVSLVIGGAGSLAAAAWLLAGHARRRDRTCRVLASLELYLGVAAMIAAVTSRWDVHWWFAHGLRFAAFAITLQIVLRESQELRARLADSEDGYRRVWNQLETILATTPDCMFLLDAAGDCTFVNRAGAALIGAEGVEDGPRWLAERVAQHRGGTRRHALGGRVYHSDQRAIVGEGGRAEGSLLTLHDETELEEKVRARTAELETQRRLLETTLQQLPAAVIVGEAPSGRLIFANDRTEEVWGHALLPSQSIADHRMWRGVHPDGRPYAPHDWPLARAIVRGEIVVAEETRILRGDDRPAVLLLSAAPVRDAAGAIVAGVVVCEDVTRRVETERALRLAEQRLRSILDNLPITLYTLDADRRYETCQGFGLARLGIDPANIVGKLAGAVDRRIEWYDRALDRTYAGENVSADGPAADGWFATHTTPLRDAGGAVTGVLGLTIDITARRRAEEAQAQDAARAHAALEASRLKSAFLATMSHEIRTPLNGVMGMVGLLLDSPLTREQREYADGIKSSGASLLTVINDILDLSKVEAGKLELEAFDFALSALVDDTVKLLRHVAAAKGLLLRCELDPGLPRTVRGDPGRIRQILNNLIANALKFTAEGGVTVRVAPAAAADGRVGIRCEVEDTGPGISAEVRAALFTPFTQGDASTSRRFGGTGLGLSICRGLVEQMHGAIEVVSEPGAGATFGFTIELEAARLQASASLAVPRPTRRLRARALVAEDNGVNLVITVRLLERIGMTVDAVGNGVEALDALERFPYDLVLMDCQMPEMDGYEATRRIRASGSRRNLPVIALTASAIKGDRERCLEAGMNDYLPKPIDAERLYSVVEHWLGG